MRAAFALALSLCAAPAAAATLDDNGTTTISSFMSIDSAGRVTKPNNPFFIAGGSAGANLTCGGAGWIEHPYNTVGAGNAGGWFNTSTGRFTAPVNGAYLFVASAYVYPAAASMSYVHFEIGVNGCWQCGGGRIPSGSHQINGLANGTEGTYGNSPLVTRLLWLNAGDYASVSVYCSGTGAYSYANYSYFAGVLLQ